MLVSAIHWSGHQAHLDGKTKPIVSWNESGMIVPDLDDPPELEFYKLQPLQIGDTSQSHDFIGFFATYVWGCRLRIYIHIFIYIYIYI
jgi:hypothetical protein